MNAPQLLKHTLGIANTFQKDFFQKDFTLLYLWYDCSFPEATEHRAEVGMFMQRLNGEIDFRAMTYMTYQELFKKMQSAPAVDGNYIAYLAERYIPA